ncbi:MAG: methionine synthase, partial [bacterium]|nr:methionine synthase [bacterium]
GNFPQIFDNPKTGEEARKLFDDANAMLDRLTDQKLLKANGVFGLFPANSNGDDIEIYSDNGRKNVLTVLHMLRQQSVKSKGNYNKCLSDYIAPAESGINDHIGVFAVSAGHGINEAAAMFEKQYDDYNAIMIKALADRLTEAFAELLHEKVRKEYWGYSPDENFTNEDLVKEKYTGIRPAPGYPACPDHTEKRNLFDLIDVEGNTGISLTENYAMIPAASVCGIYFANPEAEYFTVGRIGKDQVSDYSKRKGMSIREAEKWLSTVLNYK